MVVAGKAGIDGDQWAQCVQDRGWLWNGASAGSTATLILAHGAGAPVGVSAPLMTYIDGQAALIAR